MHSFSITAKQISRVQSLKYKLLLTSCFLRVWQLIQLSSSLFRATPSYLHGLFETIVPIWTKSTVSTLVIVGRVILILILFCLFFSFLCPNIFLYLTGCYSRAIFPRLEITPIPCQVFPFNSKPKTTTKKYNEFSAFKLDFPFL